MFPVTYPSKVTGSLKDSPSQYAKIQHATADLSSWAAKSVYKSSTEPRVCKKD